MVFTAKNANDIVIKSHHRRGGSPRPQPPSVVFGGGGEVTSACCEISRWDFLSFTFLGCLMHGSIWD